MRSITVGLLTLGALALAGCGDSTGAGEEPRVSLSFATTGSTPATAAGFFMSQAAPDTLRDGQNELIISKVEIVLREVELERVEVQDCDVEPEPVGCEDFETGPILLDLPLGGTVAKQFTIPVDTGTYNEVEFDVHKPSSGDAADQTFVNQHPDFADISIRVEGTFNDQSFVYITDLNVEQELALVPALVIAEGVLSTNVTIKVDLDAWFRDAGGALVDPATANKGGANENLVRDNIIDSMEAFEDQDEDGEVDGS